MRMVFLICAIGGFAALALFDLKNGHVRTGIAGLCLALANLLLLK